VPRVSILLPARDAAWTLPAALESVRRQTFPDWECIVVDDGSRDDTAAVATGVDPRIVVLRGPRRGIVPALATGLDACTGEFVARFDADDLMHRERLALQVAALDADRSLAGVGARVRFFPRRGMTDGLRAYEAWLNAVDGPAQVAAEAYVECPIANPTLMLRRRVLDELGWRDCGWPEDWDLLLRLVAAGHRLGVVPRRLLAWRDHPARVTRTHPAYGTAALVACRAAFLASGFLASSPRFLLWGYGGTGRALRAALATHGRTPAAIVEVHPGRLGQRIHGAPVVAPDALATLPRLPLVASVAGSAARGEIRAFCTGLGWVEGVDFVCAA
jgi:cellulose synthase/poly-beta-1,6-N-acetylglucosamine synthase-like glycosyltransferase